MRILLIWTVLCIPLIVNCQDTGIRWTEGLSWSEIIQKATTENKFIFVDAYATWCAPCHKMDKDVYIDGEVGKVINDKFVSVKVQMDRTSYDNDTIKKWYNDARVLESNYTITSFPTFLFFNPNGRPMHRAVGYRGPKEFISLAQDALDSRKQYYVLLANYHPGKLDTSELKGLARALQKSGGDLASKMAVEYLSRIPKEQLGSDDNIGLMIEFKDNKNIVDFVVKYLTSLNSENLASKKNMELITSFSSSPEVKKLIVIDHLKTLDDKSLKKQFRLLSLFKKDFQAQLIANNFINRLQFSSIFEKELLTFISDFTNSSQDRGFRIFYKYPDRVDKALQIKDYAINKVMNVIIIEEYDKLFQEAVKSGNDIIPWSTISQRIENKYNARIAQRLDIQVKSSLYKYLATTQNKYWSEYIKYYIDKIEKNGYDTTNPQIRFIDVMAINNFVFDAIFYHSEDIKQINTGLRWMEGVIRRNPREANNIDTYANLLYKAGKVKEAIQWQEYAVRIALEEKSDAVLPSLRSNLAKMKKGEPTWLMDSIN